MKIKQFFKNLKNSDPKPKKPVATKDNIQKYYDSASGWAYDTFDALVVSRDRWKLFGMIMIVIEVLLITIIILMFPLKEYVPFVVHQDANGVIWVEPPNNSLAKDKIPEETEAQIRSKLYFFVTAFESYDPYTTLHISKHYVQAWSSPEVYNQFMQQLSDPKSYLTKLAANGSRKIKVESIQMLI